MTFDSHCKRRGFLAAAVTATVPIAGCPEGNGDPETTETGTLVVTGDETHTIDATESYAAIEWHGGGTLVVESGAALQLTEAHRE